MRIPFDKFVMDGADYADHYYTDIYFYDTLPKGKLRHWRLTYDHQDKEWYSTLRRSETELDAFDDGRVLPKAFTAALTAFYMMKDGRLKR